MSFWKNKTILVTGGGGFLGSSVVRKIENFGSKAIVIRKKDFDLTKIEDIKRLFSSFSPNIVIHLAAKVGGIAANKENPAKFFYDNAIMGLQLLEEAYKKKIEKFVIIGTICSYPKFSEIPFKEENLWNGYPEETNAPYGVAKKMMLVQSQIYRKQYGFNSIYLLPANLYGPGDNFDLKKSHVIAALIRRFLNAKKENKESVEIWGTGDQTREFLYVEDAADAILLATEKYNKSDPVNIGTGYEISIKNLAIKIAKLCNYKGDIKWNASLPIGQPRRMLDTQKAFKEFGFKSKMDFDKGLVESVKWYKEKSNS